jgi:hypothetical protein
VENEVSKVLTEERRRKQVVLFPVRIDQTVMKTDEPWAVMQRNGTSATSEAGRTTMPTSRRSDRVLRDLKAAPGYTSSPGFP